MEQRNIAFIGGGNMARSLVSGLIHAGYPAACIRVTDLDQDKLDALQQEFGVQTFLDNFAAADGADVLVLAVKPQYMAEALDELTERLGTYGERLVISIAAGISVTRLSALLGGHRRIVRCMPNTPALIGLGMTGLFADPSVPVADCGFAESMLQSVGKTVWVGTESGINSVIAASGSAPAYFFLFMEAMAAEAQRMGFSAEQARLLVQQTALGAAQMVVDNPQLELATLRAQVTSKGGTTAEAIRSFEEQGLANMVSTAMQAAVTRAEEMETLF
ncbi:pyrroline-5-carboxylate reductase [Pseudaeromonas sharmana]|uniref:Pyrroline-5-carboxylate reductase n=1 Tax=Pseudaeromonas sharmana TaxID=328412 RepID=A0ABV8CM77_9GAMM